MATRNDDRRNGIKSANEIGHHSHFQPLRKIFSKNIFGDLKNPPIHLHQFFFTTYPERQRVMAL
jgi:hypothetical protein